MGKVKKGKGKRITRVLYQVHTYLLVELSPCTGIKHVGL